MVTSAENRFPSNNGSINDTQQYEDLLWAEHFPEIVHKPLQTNWGQQAATRIILVAGTWMTFLLLRALPCQKYPLAESHGNVFSCLCDDNSWLITVFSCPWTFNTSQASVTTDWFLLSHFVPGWVDPSTLCLTITFLCLSISALHLSDSWWILQADQNECFGLEIRSVWVKA